MLIAENAKWDLHNRMDDIIDEYLCYNGSIVNMGVNPTARFAIIGLNKDIALKSPATACEYP